MSEPERVSLHTEAVSIKDWQSVCDHIIVRSSAITHECGEFLHLFEALRATYGEYEHMADKMRCIVTNKKEFVEVPEYEQTAIHRGCALVGACLQRMRVCYGELHKYLVGVCDEIRNKEQEWTAFVDEIVPYTECTKEHYLTKEHQLKKSMDAYMRAAEHNDRSFFVVARNYQRTLLEFEKVLKTSTDSMQDVIKRVQSVENEKKKFESRMQRVFIESVLNQQALIRETFASSLAELQKLNAANANENAWNLLTEKLQLYNGKDGKTIFDDAVPNKAGALIKSWMEGDIEMTANVTVNGVEHKMIVTRWGFVQIYDAKNDIEPTSEFYVYDYQITPSSNEFEHLTTTLTVRQHQTWAPLEGLIMHYDIAFDDEEIKEKFETLVEEFQATHAPQT